MEQNKQQNITIIGAGLVGTSLALGLRDLPIQIRLLEKHLPDSVTNNAATQARPISLSHGSHLILKALGVWPSLAEVATPILTVHVSEQGRFGMTRFKAQEFKVPALGYVVPFSSLQMALYQAVAKLDNVKLMRVNDVVKVSPGETGATLTALTSQGEAVLTTDLLIGADGTQSTCRRLLKIATMQEDQGDIARIFSIELNGTHDNIAYERFTKMGVLAVLPLFQEDQARLVWTMNQSIATALATWPESQIFEFVQECFEGRLSIKNLAQNNQFPLTTTIAEVQHRPSCLLLGNAAHTIYPLAAQGFNLGLRDVAVLVDVLNEAVEKQQRIGGLETMNAYVDWASEHQKAIIQLTNRLSPLFELGLPGAGAMRGLGLLAMDVCASLRAPLAKRTMGTAGKLPRLMR